MSFEINLLTKYQCSAFRSYFPLRGYGFSAVLGINRVSILVINRVWLYSLELDMFLGRSYIFIIINKTIDISLRFLSRDS